MSPEVYSTVRPAVPLRAWGVTASLLLAACGLAGWLSRGRVGTVLSELVNPPGWSISFRAPGRFEERLARTEGNRSAVVYRSRAGHDGTAELAVWRFTPTSGLDASEVCDRLLRPYTTFVVSLMVPKRQATLGPWDGLEAMHPGVPIVVRAAVLANGEGYAVTLRVDDGLVDAGLYRIFNAVCDSIMSIPGGRGGVLQPAQE